MSTEPWPDGYGRIVLAETDSTNSEAQRRVPELSGPTWILALKQTAARGRRGREWVNPKGNFAATLAMRPAIAPDLAALRSFVAALALSDALAAATGRPGSISLKWPNDVLLNGGKVAGILLESAGQGTQISHLAIGIGVNLATAPTAAEVEAGATRPVSVLSETGAAVEPEAFLDLLAPAFARYEAQLQAYGFGPIREAWLRQAVRLGEPVKARTGNEEVIGTFETVDEQGNLVLITPKGRRAVAAADIYF